jgi:hypothetical protein
VADSEQRSVSQEMRSQMTEDDSPIDATQEHPARASWKLYWKIRNPHELLENIIGTGNVLHVNIGIQK